MITEITTQELNTESFISEKVEEIKDAVGGGTAINALSGGVDSSTVTMLGHRALGDSPAEVMVTSIECRRVPRITSSHRAMDREKTVAGV